MLFQIVYPWYRSLSHDDLAAILVQQNSEKATMLVYLNVLWELNALLMLCVFFYHEYQKLLGSLRKDVFERGASTGSGHFEFSGCGFCQYFRANCLRKSGEKALTWVAQKRSRVHRKAEATIGW